MSIKTTPQVNLKPTKGKPNNNSGLPTTDIGKPLVNHATDTGTPQVNLDTETGLPMVNQGNEPSLPDVENGLPAVENGKPQVNHNPATGLPQVNHNPATGLPQVNHGKPSKPTAFDWLKPKMTTSLNTTAINWIKDNCPKNVGSVTALINFLITAITNLTQTATDAMEIANQQIQHLTAELEAEKTKNLNLVVNVLDSAEPAEPNKIEVPATATKKEEKGNWFSDLFNK